MLSEDIPASPEVVRDFYVDLRNTIEVHPLVVSVTPEEPVETPAGYSRTYRVRDRIPLGPLVLPIEYLARVHVPVQGDVRTEARQFPRVRLDGTVSFDAIDGADATRLTERLVITAPWMLATFTVREARKAHRTMLDAIATHFTILT